MQSSLYTYNAKLYTLALHLTDINHNASDILLLLLSMNCHDCVGTCHVSQPWIMIQIS